MTEKIKQWAIKGFMRNTLSEEPLTDEQTANGVRQLTTVVEGVPGLNRRYIDPPIIGQSLGLVSFIPAKDVIPNEKGFYGYIKLRGNYEDLGDCSKKCKNIIQHVDSTNHIHVCRVGLPVPLVGKGFADNIETVDIKEVVEKDLSLNIQRKAHDERAEIENIQQRAEDLQESVKTVNEEEEYMTTRTKLAVHKWTRSEYKTKIAELDKLIEDAKTILHKETKEHPEWEVNYLSKYLEARKKANIPDDQTLTGFMGFVRKAIDED